MFWVCNYTIWNKGDNSLLFLHFPFTPPLAGKTLQRADSSLGLAMLWGSSLDWGRGIFDGMFVCIEGMISLQDGFDRLECVTRASLAKPVGSGSALAGEWT